MLIENEGNIRELIRKNDIAVLDVIYDQLGNRLYKYLLAILGSKERAEDVMQDLFVAIAEKRTKLAKVENITGYLFAMARNKAKDFLKSRKRREESISDRPDILVVKDHADTEIRKEDLADVSRVFSSLPLKQREIIGLKIFEEMTFKDIANALNISSNTAASRYRYGLAKMKKMLRKFNYGTA